MDQVLSAALQPIIDAGPRIGIVLGSGLNNFAEEINNAISIPYTDIPGLKASTAPGHRGRFIVGRLSGVPVLAMQGRLHYYEGYQMSDVVYPIRLMHRLGIRTLLLSNAAGGINENFSVSDLMLIKDHINFMGTNPLIGPVQAGELRFPDMTYGYDPGLQDIFRNAAADLGISLCEGVYLGTSGPSYETPAEIRAFRSLGADAVGMSTVPEVITANALKMKVAAVSCIANMAAGILPERLTEEDVLAAGKLVEKKFSALICRAVESVESLEG